MTALSTDDQLAIRTLAHEYFDAVDRGDGTALGNLFVVDGELAMVRPEGDHGPTGTRKGRDEIAAQTNWLAQKYRLTAHILASHAIDDTGDVVRGRVRCVAHHLSLPDHPDSDRVVYLRYHDEYERDDERWRFLSRTLRIELSAVFGFMPADRVPSS